MTFEFNKIEMKTARNLLAEVASCSYSRFDLGNDQLRIEIALKAMDVINKWEIKNYTCGIYRMKFIAVYVNNDIKML